MNRTTLLICLLTVFSLSGSICQADELSDLLNRYQQQRQTITNVSFTPSGGWSVVRNQNAAFNRNIPEEAHQTMIRLLNQGRKVKSIAFTPKGGWSVLYDKNGFFNRNIPDEAHQLMTQRQRAGDEIKCLAFTPRGGWSLLYGKNGYMNRNIPDETHQKIKSFADQGSTLKWVAFTPSGGWSVFYNQTGYFNRNIPEDTHQVVVQAANQRKSLKRIAFGPGGSWCVLYGENEFQYQAASSNPATLVPTIAGYLKDKNVPGVSIAVIKQRKVVWTAGVGLARTSSQTKVTPETLFQAASVSKPVAAAGALRMVDANQLSLDAPVNNSLKSWKVPVSQLTRNSPVTLRRLLSHTAGTTVHGFGGYRVNQQLPSLVQILNGQSPANSPAVTVFAQPGTRYKYSGGGYCITQQLMIDVANQSFPTLMQQHLLTPLKMTNSTYQQPLPNGWQSKAAHGYDEQQRIIPGNWHIYPEQAAAGLWTTPSDLAKFVIAIQNSHRQQGQFLKQTTARDLLTRQLSGSPGLGLFINGDTFSHTGVNEGFRANIQGNTATGDGIVIMANSENGAALYPLIISLMKSHFGLSF